MNRLLKEAEEEIQKGEPEREKFLKKKEEEDLIRLEKQLLKTFGKNCFDSLKIISFDNIDILDTDFFLRAINDGQYLILRIDHKKHNDCSPEFRELFSDVRSNRDSAIYSAKDIYKYIKRFKEDIERMLKHREITP